MSVFELVQDLKSFRSCKDEVIPRKKMGKILEAGRQAPSPKNVQSLEFIVVEDHQKLEFMEEASGDTRVSEAPTAVVLVADIDRMARHVGNHFAREASNSEAAIAAQNMRLVAKEEGIGSVWIGGFDEDVVAEQLDVPSGKQPLGILLFGYTDNEIERDPKFGLNSVCFYDSYDNQIDSVFDGLEWKGLRENREIYGKKADGIVSKLKQKARSIL
jgi:nitroreductase